ncbi:SPOR domain-containing protein [Orrella marina]|uniref:Cell division protein n=1 Tax=Orrella marina TaxID=2163011 RepID=A0A2R4XM24_9BURK|nr:SPOR domain-containing protein [Orrella marina]AWB34789.1 cell division protein [Orrella marina]
MARQKRTTQKRGGSTFYGILVGLIGGLAAAAAVAYFVMSSPMPFIDKASREDPVANFDPRTAPDPNKGLFGGSESGSSGASGQVAPAPKPKDELGELIATLPVEPGKRPPPLPEVPRTTPSPSKPAQDGRSYYLQVGAFRVLEDAEALQAQMLLIGLPVQIQRADVNGVLVNRVRVGPFSQLDEMNKARSRLSQESIQSNVVRQ